MCWLLLCAVPEKSPLPPVPRNFAVRQTADNNHFNSMTFDLYDINCGGCACCFFAGDTRENIAVELEKTRQRWLAKGLSVNKTERMLKDKRKALEYKFEVVETGRFALTLETWLRQLADTTRCYVIAYWQDRNKPKLAPLTFDLPSARSLSELSDNQWYRWSGSVCGK